jgi:hypothetical protein
MRTERQRVQWRMDGEEHRMMFNANDTVEYVIDVLNARRVCGSIVDLLNGDIHLNPSMRVKELNENKVYDVWPHLQGSTSRNTPSSDSPAIAFSSSARRTRLDVLSEEFLRAAEAGDLATLRKRSSKGSANSSRRGVKMA